MLPPSRETYIAAPLTAHATMLPLLLMAADCRLALPLGTGEGASANEEPPLFEM